MIIQVVTGGAALSLAWLAWKTVDYLCPWLKYDIRLLRLLTSIAKGVKSCNKRKPAYTVVDKFLDQANDHPDRPFIFYQDDMWTYKRMNDYSNKVGRVLHDDGMKTGVSVALLMHSCPKFVGTWFGIGKTGAATAFINHNLQSKPLLHCLKIADCKILVMGSDTGLIQAVHNISKEIEDEGIKIYIVGIPDEEPTFKHALLDPILDAQPPTEIPLEWREGVTMYSEFAYVYTSGTTGLPKAGLLRFDRAFSISQILKFSGATSDDIVYTALPLYHAAAGILGLLGSVNIGASIVIRRKFSASQFWDDCRKYNATVVQYIGEVIRYVCDTPEKENDKNHCVRLAIGNGLRPTVWKKFLDRFGENIRVFEFYGSSEGPVASFNVDNHLGSVGSLSPLLKATGLVKLVKYDKGKDELCKDSNGRCIEVPDGTPGLLIGKITKKTPFHGYRGNKKQTESKILRNVFKDGDCYFNSGDLLRRDPDYHLYFVDRVGDTFRWKGENVSTNEVADILSDAPSIKEANVYGVEISGNEGRAGMAVVLLDDDTELDTTGVFNHATESLASYACPLFLRVKAELELTGTYKQKKVQLVNEGCDPANMGGDPVYFLDRKQKSYVPLTPELYQDILTNKIKI